MGECLVCFADFVFHLFNKFINDDRSERDIYIFKQSYNFSN